MHADPPLLRLTNPIDGPLRWILGIFGLVFAVGPWVATLTDRSGLSGLWEGSLLILPTGIGILLLAGAVAARATVAYPAGDQLVVERSPSPLLPARTDRYPAASIRSITVRADYDTDISNSRDGWTWQVDGHVEGRRRPLRLMPSGPDRERCIQLAEQLAWALGVPCVLPENDGPARKADPRSAD